MRMRVPAAILLLLLSATAASAQTPALSVGFAWQYFVPSFGPAKDLDPSLSPVVSVSFGSPDSRIALVGRTGLWQFFGGSEQELEVVEVPFLLGMELAAVRGERLSLLLRLSAGAAWLKIRDRRGGNNNPPLEDALFKESEFRLAGSGAILCRLRLSSSFFLETGGVVDVLYFDDSQLPGFIGIPLGIVGEF